MPVLRAASRSVLPYYQLYRDDEAVRPYYAHPLNAKVAGDVP
jgi:uncharacterized membrane protein